MKNEAISFYESIIESGQKRHRRSIYDDHKHEGININQIKSKENNIIDLVDKSLIDRLNRYLMLFFDSQIIKMYMKSFLEK